MTNYISRLYTKAFLFQIKGPAELDEQELSSIPDILQTYKGEISQLIAE